MNGTHQCTFACVIGFMVVTLWPGLACSQQPAATQTPVDENQVFTLRTSLKGTFLLSHAPDAPALFPDRTTSTAFGRFRFDSSVRVSPTVSIGGAYDQRLRVSSQNLGLTGAAILPPETPAPFRVTQLDWQLSAGSDYAWRHEIDRAFVAFHFTGADITVGRQAVGWGRGLLFGAVDIFAPFSPVEVDREWRRGIDAIRADVKLGDRTSLDLVSAFGEDIDHSAFAARLRGYTGRADVEVVGGRRAEDLFGGITSSAAIGDAEVHGELAVFHVPPSTSAPGMLVDTRSVISKVVVGGSYQFRIGHGLLTDAEYHYSGFGVTRPEAILPALANPDYRERYIRGDTQILLRHALAFAASYEFSPELSVATQWLMSPSDGSGLLSPAATITLGDKVSLLASVYLSYGEAPEGLTVQSEYGSMARSALVQIRVYP